MKVDSGARALPIAMVGVVAFAVRIVPVLTGGGLLSWGRYDDGVYYAAAASLLDGRMPYRDFVLLHPPLIALVLLPFALLGRLTTDPTGLVAARLVWMLLGTATAMVTAGFARRWGTWAAVGAGLLYACSVAASYGDQTMLLEPVGDLAVLLAVLLLSRDRRRPRTDVIAGLLLGVAMSDKIWYVAPVAAVLLYQLLHRRWGTAIRTGAAALGAVAVIVLPFFIAAPSRMVHRVLLDQLGRRVSKDSSPSWRLGYAFGGRGLGLPPTLMMLVIAVVTVAGLLALILCLVERSSRLIALVCAAELVVLVASPSFFKHYGHFPAAPLAIVLAVGGRRIGRRFALRRTFAAVAFAVILASGVAVAVQPQGATFPTAAIRAALPRGCVTSDDPTALILVDRLSADLRAGCEVAVDVTGASYGTKTRRRHNVAFQRWLRGYLRSGSAVILASPRRDKLSPSALHSLGRLVASVDGVQVYLPDLTGSSCNAACVMGGVGSRWHCWPDLGICVWWC